VSARANDMYNPLDTPFKKPRHKEVSGKCMMKGIPCVFGGGNAWRRKDQL
jgi:hypothetical protein